MECVSCVTCRPEHASHCRKRRTTLDHGVINRGCRPPNRSSAYTFVPVTTASVAECLLTPENLRSHLLVEYGDGQGYQRGQQRHPPWHARYWDVARFAGHPNSDGACAD